MWKILVIIGVILLSFVYDILLACIQNYLYYANGDRLPVIIGRTFIVSILWAINGAITISIMGYTLSYISNFTNNIYVLLPIFILSFYFIVQGYYALCQAGLLEGF